MRQARVLPFFSLLLAAAATAWAGPPASRLAVRFGEQGPESIVWDQRKCWHDNPLGLPSNSPATPGLRSRSRPKWKAAAGVVRTYEQATVACTYSQAGKRLLLDLEIRNDSNDALVQARIVPLRMQFPVGRRAAVGGGATMSRPAVTASRPWWWPIGAAVWRRSAMKTPPPR